MKPLEVVFRLSRPTVTPESPIHLDALLAWSVTDRHLRSGPAGALREFGRHLPLGEEVRGDARCWQASWICFDDPRTVGQRMAVRRTDVDDMARRVSAGQLSTGRMNKMSLGGGHYRNHLFWYPLFEAKTARAWCIGDPAALADLLGDVQYLGRKRSNGHGRIEEIEIRDAPEAVSLWMHRVMPWEVPGYVPVTAATEPPYWSPETQRSAWQPMELVPART